MTAMFAEYLDTHDLAAGLRLPFRCPYPKAGEAGWTRLAEADRRRVTLWLDANSLYYGAFYNFEKQKEGKEIVWPILDVDPDAPLADCE